jgi:hypothetical protein
MDRYTMRKQLEVSPFLGFSNSSMRVDTTNSNTDWPKKKQSHASLVHDTGLTNEHPSKRHATLPPAVDELHLLHQAPRRGIAAQSCI